MRLFDRIEAEGMSPEVLAAFRQGLDQVAGSNGFASMERALLSGLFERLLEEDVEPAPMEDLWPHAELFLTAALTLAVTDGNYGVEEARVIGSFASRLGYSAAGLAAIEDRVFEDLRGKVRSSPPPPPLKA